MTVEDIRGVYDVKVQLSNTLQRVETRLSTNTKLSKTLQRVETRLVTNTKSAEFQSATN